jgi:DNA-binding beta-propeller fold protein YncE
MTKACPWVVLLAVAGCAPPAPPGEIPTASGRRHTASDPPSPTPKATKPKATVFVDTVGPFVPGVHGMAFDANSVLWFSDSFGNHDKQRQVYRLPPPYTGAPESTGLTAGLPAALLWADGHLYLSDVKAKTVTRYDANLTATTTWTNVDAWTLAGSLPGDLLATTASGRVLRLHPDGTAEELLTASLAPFGLALHDEGYWLTEQGAKPGDPGRLTLRTPTGTVLFEVDYPWANPEGLLWGPNGQRLWVAETERGEVVAVDPVGGTVEVLAMGLKLPVVLARAPDGAIYVSTGDRLTRLRLSVD